MRIVVIPDLLEDRARQMAQAAAQLYEIEGRLSHALSALDWEARQKAGVEGQVNAARSRARGLAGEAERLARYLADRAADFRQADAQGVQSLAATFQGYHSAVQPFLPSARNNRVPDQRSVQQHAWLGTLLTGAELVGAVAAPLYLMSRASVDAGGRLIIYGSRPLKELSGLSPHLTHIRPEHLARHWLLMEKKLSLSRLANAASAFDVGIAALHAYQNHAGQGWTAVASAALVDSAVAIGTKKLFALGGAAIGTPLGPFGAMVGYAVGSAAGVLVADWLRNTPHQQALRDIVRQGIEVITVEAGRKL